jgi:hypothetical protein
MHLVWFGRERRVHVEFQLEQLDDSLGLVVVALLACNVLVVQDGKNALLFALIACCDQLETA